MLLVFVTSSLTPIVLYSTLILVSSLIYAFAAARKTIAEGGIRQSRWPWSNDRKQLEHYEIIQDNDTKMQHPPGEHEDHCADTNKDDNNKKKCGCLKAPLDGTKLQLVLTPSNMEHLANDPELSNELNMEALLAMKELGHDGLLWEFDDEFGDSRQLVYAITVNKYVLYHILIMCRPARKQTHIQLTNKQDMVPIFPNQLLFNTKGGPASDDHLSGEHGGPGLVHQLDHWPQEARPAGMPPRRHQYDPTERCWFGRGKRRPHRSAFGILQ